MEIEAVLLAFKALWVITLLLSGIRLMQLAVAVAFHSSMNQISMLKHDLTAWGQILIGVSALNLLLWIAS